MHTSFTGEGFGGDALEKPSMLYNGYCIRVLLSLIGPESGIDVHR
ncbi:hypothetical protein [Aestuariibacter sp. A3R04]|nr:hypothetical protein [Aestuariibacter sp. A3R04]